MTPFDRYLSARADFEADRLIKTLGQLNTPDHRAMIREAAVFIASQLENADPGQMFGRDTIAARAHDACAALVGLIDSVE